VFGTISRITPAGVVSTFATVGDEAKGLAFDRQGNLFVSTLTAKLYKVTPNGQSSFFASTHQIWGAGLAGDPQGNLYMSNDGGTINKITPGGVVSVFGTGTSQAINLAFDDATGNLYATEHLISVQLGDVRSNREDERRGVGSAKYRGHRYSTGGDPVRTPSVVADGRRELRGRHRPRPVVPATQDPLQVRAGTAFNPQRAAPDTAR
jgi:hypothetical protein